MLHMPVVDLVRRVPIGELFDWVAYVLEKDRYRRDAERRAKRRGGRGGSDVEIEIAPDDLKTQTPEQIARMFGAEIVKA